MKQKLTLAFLLCFAIGLQHLFAQQTVQATGSIVSEEDGEPLIGAAIMVRGTSTGTTTDINGNFSLAVPAGATLEISFVGMITLEVTAGQGLRIVMRPDLQNLDEVIVVAYGTAKKSSFTGSATAVGARQLEMRALSNVMNVLEGNVPGLQVTSGMGAPGAEPSFRIRGFSSINSNSAPLIVLDGAIFDGSFTDINPHDIESITVLKDAASTALYGSSAGNGVIMVSTKAARLTAGNHQVDVSVSQGFSRRGVADYDRLDVYQYYPAQWEMLRNVYRFNGKQDDATSATNASLNIFNQLKYNPFRNIPNDQIVGTNGLLNPAATDLLWADDDWESQAYRTGHTQDYNISFSSKTDKSDSYASVNYRNEKGFVVQTGLARFAGRVNYNIYPVKWFKAGVSLSATRTDITRNPSDDTDSSNSYNNLIRMTRVMSPIYPVHEHDLTTGDYILEGGEKKWELSSNRLADPGRHGLAEATLNQWARKRDQMTGRAYFDFNIIDGLKVSFSGNIETRNLRNFTYENKLVGDGAPMGRMSINRYGYTIHQFNEMISYAKTFGDHSIDVLAGHENYSYSYDYLNGSRQGEIASGLYEFGNFVTINSLGSSTTDYRKEGYLLRANYDYSDKYYLSASYRHDGSSRFHKSHQWGDFWSVGGSWRADQEGFLQDASWVNSLKLRASYGETGNDNTQIDDENTYYGYMTVFGIGYNNRDEPGIYFSRYGNQDLKWESAISLDAAVEFALFDRLSGTVEFFDHYNRDLIFELPVQSSAGIISYLRNIGRIDNYGVEVDLNYTAFKNRDWRVTVGANATSVKNVIKELPEDGIVKLDKRYAVGKSRYDYWLRQFVGVDSDTGNALYLYDPDQAKGDDVFEKNGQMVTTSLNKAKYDYSGSTIPKLQGGFTAGVSYRDFDLSVHCSYAVGGKILDTHYQTLMNNRYAYAMHTDVLKAWKNPGDVTDVPRLDQTRSADFDGVSSRWLISSDYLNIKNVHLSYAAPKKLLTPIGVKAARLGVGVENLMLFTARQGLNPQESFAGTLYNSYVPARTVTCTLNLSF
ncbi:MAG: SusC/RagA family TonB-linked outer membrane protein [Tannerella sp.]|jgi:TonB-linked SusC/RagA family outer membrane protein|nr:SusC/RagA family TonB-linked outer membrane protein [Tannerella sp.]